MNEEIERVISDKAGPSAAEVVDALALQYGARALHGLRLGRPAETGTAPVQLDHVLVDAYGVFIVDAKSWGGAAIRGRYLDNTWSARYPEGRTEIIHNPIRENDAHIDLLHRSLTDAGWVLGLDHVRGMAAFVNADISGLELDSVNAARVGDLEDVVERYSARMDRPPFEPMPAEMIVPLADAIEQMQAPEPLPAAAQPQERPAALPASTPTAAGLATKAPRPDRLREWGILVAGLIALLIIGWGILALLTGRGGDARKDRFVPQEQPPSSAPAGLQPVAPEVEKQADTDAKPNVALAQKRLMETYPDLYDNISNADHPRIIDVAEGQITYEWDYVKKSATNAVTVGKVSITLDAAGEVIGSSE